VQTGKSSVALVQVNRGLSENDAVALPSDCGVEGGGDRVSPAM